MVESGKMTRSAEEVRDVALVPEGYVFEGDLSVGSHDAGEAGDLFAGDGVALVRHGAGAPFAFR